MELYILRHGLATEKGDPRYPEDQDRPLTEDGQKKMLGIARRLKSLDVNFDLILSSPYTRARQTAEIVASVLGRKNKLKLSAHLSPDGTVAGLVRQLNAQRPAPKAALLVGHEPWLSQFISVLLIGKPSLPMELKKGGLCKLETDELKAGRCATLHWLLTPKTTL